MKILFLYPEYTYPRKSPPIGVASLAAYVIQEGHDAKIIDFNIDRYSADFLKEVLKDYQPDLIGVSFMTNQYANAVTLIKACRSLQPDTLIAAGGPHASALPEDLLKEMPELDITVYGEGEIPLRNIIESIRLADTNKISSVRGTCYRHRNSGDIIKNPAETELIDFSTPPWPAWHLLDLGRYRVMGSGGDSGKPTYALLSSRGCPARCLFCDSHTIFGRKFRGRTAEDMFNEIMYLHSTYGMEQFDFVDDLITTDRKRIFEFCELLQSSGKNFKWMANARLNTLDEEMLRRMKDSGCVRIDVGVESADANVRKMMNKGISNKQITKIHRFCREIGLYIGTFLMVGNLGETMESVRMTAKMMKGLTDDPSIAIACPYPGTELFRVADEKGLILTKDWSRYGTAPTFLNNFQPVMRTDTMTTEEILKAYYYLQSFFALDKFRARYGRLFFLNPVFIREYIIENRQYGGFRRKLKMALTLGLNLLKTKFLKPCTSC